MAKQTGQKWTPKLEAFAQAIAQGGKSQSDAYRQAYNASKMSANAVHCEASKLMAIPRVSQRIAELRAKLEDNALWTREMGVKALAEALQVARTGKNAQAMTGAVKELNAMHGFNAPEKVELTGKDGAPLMPSVPAELPQGVTELAELYQKLTRR